MARAFHLVRSPLYPCCATRRRGLGGGGRLTWPVPRPRVPATMTQGDLERFLLRIALPPVRLGLYVKRLKARRADPAARRVTIDELLRAARVRRRLARAGWWN